MIYPNRLKAVNASAVRGWFDDLRRIREGCVSVHFATSGDQCFYVVMGWHCVEVDKRKYEVAWKIGVQSANSVMQTDFDIDFQDPSNPDSGEVEDTTHVLDCVKGRVLVTPWRGSPSGYCSWGEMALEIRKEARRVYRVWK